MKNKTIKAWAVILFDGELPDFNVEGTMRDVYQIHSSKSAAVEMAANINKQSPIKSETLWFAVPCDVIYTIPNEKEIS